MDVKDAYYYVRLGLLAAFGNQVASLLAALSIHRLGNFANLLKYVKSSIS